MHARSSTIHAHPSFIDEGLSYVRDTVMPTLAGLDGCAGLSMLIDREAGSCILTSSWLDENAMWASEGAAAELRNRAMTIFHATAEVAHWEVAALRRDRRSQRQGAVRATWLQIDPAGLESMVDTYRMTLMPRLGGFDGFRSASLLIDRATGRAVSSVSFDDWAMMLASRDAEQEMWAGLGTGDSGGSPEVLKAAEFDLAIANLSVPQLV